MFDISTLIQNVNSNDVYFESRWQDNLLNWLGTGASLLIWCLNQFKWVAIIHCCCPLHKLSNVEIVNTSAGQYRGSFITCVSEELCHITKDSHRHMVVRDQHRYIIPGFPFINNTHSNLSSFFQTVVFGEFKDLLIFPCILCQTKSCMCDCVICLWEFEYVFVNVLFLSGLQQL